MGVALPEMDIDAILARKPQIVLVDELAHSNAPGSRHEKRWQDVEEILAAGIDVYTTVNIQHFESLNDVVAQITGITVRETVPDRLLDLAFEIKLIDIPPEDLLQRLHEGKVYIADQAAKAIEKFFRPGNLMALRELSLRRTAARVDDQMRAYMETQSIAGPWATAERLLVCVSGSPYSEKLIRATCRLAEELKAQWFTVYIETPGGEPSCPGEPGAYLARPASGREPGRPGCVRHRHRHNRCGHGIRHTAQHHQDRDGQTEPSAAGAKSCNHRSWTASSAEAGP